MQNRSYLLVIVFIIAVLSILQVINISRKTDNNSISTESIKPSYLIKQEDIVVEEMTSGWKRVTVLGAQFSFPASLEFSRSHIDDISVTFTLSPEKGANPNLIFEITLRKVKYSSVDLKTQLSDEIEASIKSGYTSSSSTPVVAKLGTISAYKYSQIVNSFKSLNYAARNKDIDLHVSTGLYQRKQTAQDLALTQKIISSFKFIN